MSGKLVKQPADGFATEAKELRKATDGRMKDVRNSIDILRQTLGRRFAPDKAVDDAVTRIECEVLLLASHLKEERQ